MPSSGPRRRPARRARCPGNRDDPARDSNPPSRDASPSRPPEIAPAWPAWSRYNPNAAPMLPRSGPCATMAGPGSALTGSRAGLSLARFVAPGCFLPILSVDTVARPAPARRPIAFGSGRFGLPCPAPCQPHPAPPNPAEPRPGLIRKAPYRPVNPAKRRAGASPDFHRGGEHATINPKRN